tara:strand:+ start:157 stop:366 length:210 start_codon:yes stop_codon:yes gene_type:complete
MDKLLEAVKEASISVACLLDDIAEDENNDIKVFEIEKDIKHLQDQITIIENYLDPFVVEELNHIKQEKS